jgi:hypothetical protein
MTILRVDIGQLAEPNIFTDAVVAPAVPIA